MTEAFVVLKSDRFNNIKYIVKGETNLGDTEAPYPFIKTSV